MKAKCPGQSSRKPLQSLMLTCPSCGAEVELFSDEGRRRCSCGHVVVRQTLPTCAEWCPAAAQCFGQAADVRVLKKRVDRIKTDPRAKRRLRDVRRRLEGKGENGRDD